MCTKDHKTYAHLFPMTVCGRSFSSFHEIDKAFGLTDGRAYMRYVRNGLRGDDLGRKTKRHNDVLNTKVRVGRTEKTVRQWLKDSGICLKTFYSRLYELGFPIERACTVATGVTSGRNKTGRIVEWRGKEYRVVDFATACGLSVSCVAHRLRAGWTPQQIYDRPADARVHYKKRAPVPIRSIVTKAAREHGVPAYRIASRLRSGWSMEDAVSRPLHDRTVAMARNRKNEMAKLGIVI